MTVTVDVAVKTASEDVVLEAGAKRVGIAATKWPFLPRTSKLLSGRARGLVEHYYDHPSPPRSVINAISDYSILSAWAHTFDGWRFLSQAALALVNASRSKALHLSYYAELRAVLSILSGSGIGVLKNKHYALSNTGAISWFRGSTHTKAWEALKAWSNIPSNGMRVIDALGTNSILGIPWIEVCRATSLPQEVAGRWLQDWAIDLLRLSKDQDLRNEASYRPDLTDKSFDPLVLKELQLIRTANGAFNPDALNSGDLVDVALVNDLCENVADNRYASNSGSQMFVFWQEVLQWLVTHGKKSHEEALAIIRLLRNARTTPAGHLLQEADRENTSVSGVFCRALFLLRLASAMLRRQKREMERRAHGGVLKWPFSLLSQFGLHSQVWEEGKEPGDYSTLDQDKNDADDEIAQWLDENNPSFSGFRLWSDKATATWQICRFERLGLMLVSA